MKPYSFENIFPDSSKRKQTEMLTGSDAEEKLNELLENPDNAFLTQVPQNREQIDNFESAADAVLFAEDLIRRRLKATLNAREVYGGHSERIEVNPDTVLNTLDHIKAHAKEIGRGADGYVVVDITDTTKIHPEICYKFALTEGVKRGRNSIAEEAELQGAFYEVAQSLSSRDISVPMPYYEVEVFTTQMIAMEKLHAKSVDEILRGIGTLPPWVDIDRFCDSLTVFIDKMHENNLYHRDMHFGNIMISQRPVWSEGEPMGYVIDFGLSAYAQENMEPYKKELAGYVFTFDNDYGRIQTLRKSLKELQIRRKANHV